MTKCEICGKEVDEISSVKNSHWTYHEIPSVKDSHGTYHTVCDECYTNFMNNRTDIEKLDMSIKAILTALSESFPFMRDLINQKYTEIHDTYLGDHIKNKSYFFKNKD